MYCTKCGTNLENNETVCHGCGCPVVTYQPLPVQQIRRNNFFSKLSKASLANFIFYIIGAFSGILSIILSIVICNTFKIFRYGYDIPGIIASCNDTIRFGFSFTLLVFGIVLVVHYGRKICDVLFTNIDQTTDQKCNIPESN